jgi:hypothetical protein
MEKHSETRAGNRRPVAQAAVTGAEREPALELCDDQGPIPTFPPRKLDEHGRLIPISPEERAARHAAAIRALAALDKLPDDDPPDVTIQMMRGIASRRPPGQKIFEGLY